MRQAVVLVHGIWMRGGSLFALTARLRRAGFSCHPFTYASVRRSAAHNAAQLNAFAEQIDAGIVHFVGHSLGGIVILHLFNRYPGQRPGRVVLLGAPVRGSAVARRVADNALARIVFGRSLSHGLLGGVPAWPAARPLGVIAGTGGLGVGRLVGGLEGANDGTVALAETHLANAADSLALPVSHTGMVFSRTVARQVCAFLAQGQFDRG